MNTLTTFAQKCQQVATLAGWILNSGIRFISMALGPSSGKLLSIVVVCFTIWICWQGFWGQVNTVSALQQKENPTEQDLAVIRETYNGALNSVSVPLGILVGAFPTIIGIGFITKKLKGEKSDSENIEDGIATTNLNQGEQENFPEPETDSGPAKIDYT